MLRLVNLSEPKHSGATSRAAACAPLPNKYTQTGCAFKLAAGRPQAASATVGTAQPPALENSAGWVQSFEQEHETGGQAQRGTRPRLAAVMRRRRGGSTAAAPVQPSRPRPIAAGGRQRLEWRQGPQSSMVAGFSR